MLHALRAAVSGGPIHLPFDQSDFEREAAQLDPVVGEAAQPKEAEAAFLIASTIVQGLARKFGTTGDPKVRRDAHPRSHGCVKVEFRVREDLPPHLAKGLFRPGAVYHGLARFSNTAEDTEKPDTKPDGRGMAIKLLDVPTGEPGGETMTADFLLVSHPQFMLRRVDAYVTVIRLLQGPGGMMSKILMIPAALYAMGISGLMNIMKFLSSRTASPLKLRYHSMVPYRLGEQDDPERRPVKYAATPPVIDPSMPKGAGPHYLREALKAELAAAPWRMEFQVQPLPPQGKMGLSDGWESYVEYPRRAWPEEKFPFETVATLHFPQQVLDFDAPGAFGEDLSFNPWRVPGAHRPIGAINRIRQTVYRNVSAWRRRTNHAPVDEPRP